MGGNKYKQTLADFVYSQWIIGSFHRQSGQTKTYIKLKPVRTDTGCPKKNRNMLAYCTLAIKTPNCSVMAHFKAYEITLEADLNNLKCTHHGHSWRMRILKWVWMMTCMMDNAFSL